MNSSKEVQRIIDVYGRRPQCRLVIVFFNTSSYLDNEKERYIIKYLKSNGLLLLDDKKVLEIGVGSANNIFILIKIRF